MSRAANPDGKGVTAAAEGPASAIAQAAPGSVLGPLIGGLRRAGYEAVAVWTDPKDLFSVHYLKAGAT